MSGFFVSAKLGSIKKADVAKSMVVVAERRIVPITPLKCPLCTTRLEDEEVNFDYFKFTQDETELTSTRVIFDITDNDGKTEVKLTHVGLVPEYECYDICREGWANYIQNSLRSLITTGKGKPNATGKPQAETEKKLTSSTDG